MVRYAARGLWRDRAFTVTTVATLTVALALVTTVFALFNAYVLRPYAVHDPYSLYAIRWRAQDEGGRGFRWRDYVELAERRDLFDSVIAERHRPVTSDSRGLLAAFVSGNYFDTLGGRIHAGGRSPGSTRAGRAARRSGSSATTRGPASTTAIRV